VSHSAVPPEHKSSGAVADRRCRSGRTRRRWLARRRGSHSIRAWLCFRAPCSPDFGSCDPSLPSHATDRAGRRLAPDLLLDFPPPRPTRPRHPRSPFAPHAQGRLARTLALPDPHPAMSHDQPAVVAAEPPPLERFEPSGPTRHSPPIRAGFAPPPPRPASPRSRAPSAASSIDSSRASSSFSARAALAQSSNADARPAPDLPAAQLKPAQHGDGFLVDVPGTGQWLVSWAELVDLLMSRASLSPLKPAAFAFPEPRLTLSLGARSSNARDAFAQWPHRRDDSLCARSVSLSLRLSPRASSLTRTRAPSQTV